MANDGEGAEKTEQPKSDKRKLLVIAGVAAVLLLGGGAAGAYLLGFFGGGDPEVATAADHGGAEEGGHEDAAHEEDGAAGAPAGIVFVDMPDIIVNLSSDGRRMRFLKLRVALEVENGQAAERIRSLMPRVMDSFQLYLRALTLDEVNGSAGMQRLKEELIARVNLAIEPTRVGDVLFKEMLVQ